MTKTPAPASGPDASSVDDQMNFSGRRILVAEDNPVNRRVAVRMLEQLGCRADGAANGREALFMHRALPYDLLLMDCQMPELDGYQATRQLREDETVRTPIIALTASASESERGKCLAAGMDDFISKPIHLQTLSDMLARWLPATRATHAAAAHTARRDQLETVQAAFGADFAELAALYQNDSPKRIDLLRQAVASGDAAQAARIAHVFSGSCASIGAAALSALCRELELLAKEGTLTGFAEKLDAMEAEYTRISAKLQSMIASN